MLLTDFEENTFYLYDQLQIIQPLFRVSKRNDTLVSIEEVTKKLLRYFKVELESYNIKVKIETIKDIKIKTSIGLILQMLINLMDNAIYWLHEKGNPKENQIVIRIDGNNNELLFADNGVGIKLDLAELVFMEFYTTKPKERGRGLGLYIVKEILDRMDGTIELVQNEKTKTLKGANFRILFPNDKIK
ncbi:MAG: ATP-binding protein [Bacteroidetes bacterium]|nr:ATP-binding protein [Bacteroidota bacterium]